MLAILNRDGSRLLDEPVGDVRKVVNCEPRKRFFVKTAYRYVDTKVNYVKGLLQKPMVSQHRAFINFSYETKNEHWQFDFTTQYNGAKRLPNTNLNPVDYQRPNYSPGF